MGKRRKSHHTSYIIHHTRDGFTLLEVLLSVALLSLVVGMGMPIYQEFQARNSLDIASNSAVQFFRRAQLLSQANEGDSSWGVSVQSGSVVLFKGLSYAARDSGFDESFDLSSSITPSGLTEIVFTKLYGLPQSTGTTTLTSTAGEVRNIIVNDKGMIEY